MATKLSNPLMDENPDLHKQIGCMNGLYQLFNRQHFLSGRRVSGHNRKRLPPGQSGNHRMEPNIVMQKNKEKNPEEVVKEKQRVSVESSRTSVSSTCSSTFSSVDCSKTAKSEPSSLGHSMLPGTQSQMLPTKQPNSPSLDLRNVVKDSINRETGGLLVKIRNTAEGTRRIVKHVDSPRPLQPSKPVKPKLSGLDGSSRVLAKLREGPSSYKEERSQALPPKDSPRFSYDGRESRDAWKSTVKLKELPRLSLDSRERSIRAASESRANHLLDDPQRRNVKSIQALTEQEPGSNKRPSSVVVKLMGLEAFPDSMSANNDQTRKINCCPDEDLDAMSTTSRKNYECKHNQVSRSPRTPQSKHASPQLRNTSSFMKPNLGFPLEPAPWRQLDGNRGLQKPVPLYQEAQTKGQNLCPSVYGEFQKRLTELEFKRSDKDLRALKQILDAMQKTRESLENKKEEQASDLEPKTSNRSPSEMNCSQQSIHLTFPTIKGIGPPKNFESSVVYMKSAKVVEKPRNSCPPAIPLEGMSGLHKLRTGDNVANRKDSFDKQTANDLTPRNNYCRQPSCQPICSMDKSTNAKTYRSTQSSKASQHTSGGNPPSSGRSSTTVSPRSQQKKHGIEKQSRHNSHTSDPSRARRHLSKQHIESGSPRRNFRPKPLNWQEGDDQWSELSIETRQLSYQGDSISVQSESNTSLTSQTDIEVTSVDHSKELYGAYQHKYQRTKIEARLTEDRSKAETTTATMEQPSPVSVLDTAFYREGSPSPVKKISNAFKDEDFLSFDEVEWKSVDIEHLLNSTGPKLGPDFDQEKSENLNHLALEIRQANSTHDEVATDYIRSLCENTNPDHRYITEILLASGLLKDLGSRSKFIQLHPSGHLINPNLFLILEQAKGMIELPEDKRSNEKIGQSKFNEKIHRKLTFDTVNEILAHKLTSAGFSEPWISPNKLRARSLTGQKLLKELSLELDHLQANSDGSLHDGDLMLQTPNWADAHSEIPGIVLDIERLIFKDLISEVVSGEAAGLPDGPAKHYRRLFP
ncbi:Protein LONGIFOLIA like [Actinidia chinensis var. chinensis]|uniref:Protein LONGIFOLIA like n=1 Tax=Actinidia chinensis var. chinensis TaxID=1590841 RepID=A0A2R6P9P4_ACTCC|nr:Protein LONGIFOLIA like [Actinidia chinensis var. chinensis]